MKPANYAPVYAAALYPELAEIARDCGYALAVHGTLARDFDLIAVPWRDDPLPSSDVLRRIVDEFHIKIIGGETRKPAGRTAWTLSIGHGTCAIDLSFTPIPSRATG